MKIEEIDDLGLQDLIKGDPHRSPGLHCSDLIKALMREQEPERFAERPLDPERIGVGTAFEDVLARQMGTLLHRGDKPGEFVCDGVIGSPDWFSPELWLTEEIKWTWMSSRKGITDPRFYHYFVQLRAYNHMIGQHLGGPPVLDSKLRVGFANDDYTYPLSPKIRTYQIRFTERELLENWQMLMRYRGRVSPS